MKKKELELHEIIKAERIKLKITQQEFAERLGVTRNYISMIENGKQNLSWEKIQDIAKALNSELIVKFKRIK